MSKDGYVHIGRFGLENGKANNDINMHHADNLISRKQASIYLNKQTKEWFLRDRGSRNGTSIVLQPQVPLVLYAGQSLDLAEKVVLMVQFVQNTVQ